MAFLLYLDRSARFLAPKFLAVMLLLMSVQPVGIPGLSAFMPMFEVICIYYWGIHTPKLFPAWFALFLGLLQDILYGTPLGMTALSNMLLLCAVNSQRKFLIKEPFWVQWCGFVLFAFISSVIKWLLAVVILHFWELSAFAVMQWLLTCAFYITAHIIFDKIDMTLVSSSRYAQ